MALRVLLGVAMLNVTSGVGESVNDVKLDIVMARGPSPGCCDVQTTALWGRRRMMERSCSGRGSVFVGWDVGGLRGEVCHDFCDVDTWMFRDSISKEGQLRAWSGCLGVLTIRMMTTSKPL